MEFSQRWNRAPSAAVTLIPWLQAWLPWSRRRKIDTQEFVELEVNLDNALIPVKPRSAFVSGLQGRLLSLPEPQLPAMPSAIQYLLLGFVGVLGGVLIILTGIRATLTLLGAIGILSQLKKRSAPA